MLFASVRSEALLNVSLVPIGALLSLIVYALAREAGAAQRGAGISAALTLVCPIVALQMYSSYVDLFGTTFVLGMLYWIMRLARHSSRAREKHFAVLLVGLCAGLAVGTKLNFIAWVGCLLIVFVVVLLRDRSLGRISCIPTISTIRCLLVFSGSAAICSGFWFVRNALHTGWFLYPMAFDIAGLRIGKGVSWSTTQEIIRLPHAGWTALAYPWFEWKNAGYPYSADNGAGPLIAVFAVVGTLWLVWRRLRAPRLRTHAADWVLLAVTGAGVLMFCHMFGGGLRYGMPLCALLLAASGRFFQLLLRQVPRGSIALLAATTVLSASMIALWPMKKLAGRIRDGDLSRAHAYQIPTLFDELPPGATVLNHGGLTMNYPLLGTDWTNRVIEQWRNPPEYLEAPFGTQQLKWLGVDLVYTRGADPPPFEHEVEYELVFDNTHDPERLPTTIPTRVFRIADCGLRIARWDKNRPE